MKPNPYAIKVKSLGETTVSNHLETCQSLTRIIEPFSVSVARINAFFR